ncbi:hypothetical protein DL95DRAFT_469430 [Leptodontidium sp. 2 PMI_412]|nr:hypothetical protein DL95DRAFT_469430 [Leptodontidium sp. 2 PMI_412]
MGDSTQLNSVQPVVTEKGYKACVFEKAFEACIRVNSSLYNLDLSPADRTLIAEINGFTHVKEKIRELEQEILGREKAKYSQQVSDFANSLCEFATRISGLVEIFVPQSPEYAIPFNCIMFIFKTVVAKNEKQATLSDFFMKLSHSLPLADFYSQVVPTDDMKQAVASIYMEVIDLVERATAYCCLGTLRKLSDAILQPIEYRFEIYISNIESSKQKMIELRDAAQVARQADMHYTLDNTHQALGEFRQELNVSMTQMDSSIANLYKDMKTVKEKTEQLWYFESILHVNHLIESLLPDTPTSSEEIIMARNRHSNLSQKDRWENNGILQPLSIWSAASTTSDTSVLWIGGQTGQKDTWVTELSVDIVQALRCQDINMTLAHIFFDIIPGKVTTATDFIKLVIVRIIEQRPELIMELPRLLNTRSLRQSSNFLACWGIFEQIVMRLDTTLLILDRIDVSGQSTTDSSTIELILPRLLDVVSRMAGKLRIVITSTKKPPIAYKRHPNLSSLWLDTGIRPMKRDDRL